MRNVIMTTAYRDVFEIRGIIQGIGFRPAIYRLASELNLGGSVQNKTNSVYLTLEGSAEQLDSFRKLLPEYLPPHAQITEFEHLEHLKTESPSSTFRIIASNEEGISNIQIPADLAICPDCREEVLDKNSHRYCYPFTTCTNCGPRYTVVNKMPYDRVRTTLKDFPLCDFCKREYQNKNDRRFHAETIACPKCGPQLRLCNSEGTSFPGDPIMTARSMIEKGKIIAVRGIGGFLLAADAMNRETLRELRERKARPDKPFAVMASSINEVKQYCHVSDIEEAMLTTSQAPIVILHARQETTAENSTPPLPLDLISPDTQTLGVMLPTSPLHLLLSIPTGDDPVENFPLLVMTSGNHRGEPIAIDNDEALLRLYGIADAFLLHDREINLRCDDSLCIEQTCGPQVWRRSRGYAPRSLPLHNRLKEPILAMGAELKNTIAIGFGNQLVLSPHIGDLETPEALDALEEATNIFPDFLQQKPSIIAVDMHPDMQSTRLGKKIADSAGIPLVKVQHHHAHGLSCLLEHKKDSGLALVFDGTGLGTDGSIWGAELLDINPEGFKRLATFASAPLPGGDQAVWHPARQLLARWVKTGICITPDMQDRLGATDEEIAAWTLQTRKGINAPVSHAAGRLFDAFSSAIGVAPQNVTYEGQAAIRLEAAAQTYTGKKPAPLPFDIIEDDDLLTVNWNPLFEQLATEPVEKCNIGQMAHAFHHTLALAARRMVECAFSLTEERTVALSGGVFMNRILTAKVIKSLTAIGAEVLVHRDIPPNDGGIAAGQVLAGRKAKCR